MSDFDSQMEAYTDMLERQAERLEQREQAKAVQGAPQPSREESAVAERRQNLELALASLTEQRDSAPNERFREHVERSIAAVQTQLRELDAPPEDAT